MKAHGVTQRKGTNINSQNTGQALSKDKTEAGPQMSGLWDTPRIRVLGGYLCACESPPDVS